MYGEENIIFTSDPGRLTPCDFVPLTNEESIGSKGKCLGRKRNFLKQCKKGASLNLHVGAGEAVNGLDQKLLRKDDVHPKNVRQVM